MEDEQVNRLIQHIDARIDDIDARFTERFEQIDGRFEQIDARFAAMDGRITEVQHQAEIIAEGLRHEIRLVAEGVDTANERIDRLDTTMKDEFADVRTLIHISSSAVDQRVSKLERSSSR